MNPTDWNARRKAYQAKAGPVSNPGQPSPTNRKARREREHAAFEREWKERDALLREPIDPDPPLICDCGQCLPGQDRECPARAIARAERLMDDR